MSKNFFPQKPDCNPIIYAYEEDNPNYAGCLKIGYTTKDLEDRVKQQYPTIRPGGVPYKIVFTESAMYTDGGNFMDHDIHHYLDKKGFKNVGGEWYKCSVDDLRSAWIAVRSHSDNIEQRTMNFEMRQEQQWAVDKTIAYFKSMEDDAKKKNISPKFLWNAKMRFGKTFASYKLAQKMGFKRVLILTFKPAVEDSWEKDLNRHIDFEGWQFVSKNSMKYEEADQSRPIVCFGSFQDYLGVNRETGGIKAKNEWVHETDWDIVIFDEYHFGAWRENAKKLFESTNEDSIEELDSLSAEKKPNELLDETWLPITSKYYLYLSGTPFRAINSGEFIEEQVFNWTYADEQREKEKWTGPNNPYESLPRLVLMTYRIPDAITCVARNNETNEFDLNKFFSTEGEKKEAKFILENEVQNWLDLIRGAYLDTSLEELKLGVKKGDAYWPFKETALLNVLNHTLWFLPNVNSCYAMANLLNQPQNKNGFYGDYKVNICAGAEAGVGLDALKPVEDSMDNPLETKTITLTCGKLTTGVTVKPWTGIFMLRNLSTPETYFQSAFRVQSPWEVEVGANKKEIIKKECYVFDFALDRALKQISDYATKLDIKETNPEKKVDDFIKFLPVLAYQDGKMQEIDAGQILDIAMSGTTATLLARRWESAILVNVDNATLQRLLNSEKAMEILGKIEAFRSLRKDITTVISKSEDVKKLKTEKEHLTEKEKKKISEEEKEYKSKRKQIQEKLIKFATRVPVFMYLTDFREYSLEDVITKLEPSLFKKVTGLEVEDFNLLVSLGIFNKPVMDQAVYYFKRYEDSSLSYAGINKHEGEKVGLFDTVLSDYEYKHLYELQQESLLLSKNIKNPAKLFSDAVISEQEKTVEEFKKEAEIEIEEQEENIKTIYKNEIQDVNLDEIDVGTRVYHKAFGYGNVAKIETDLIYIKFNDYKQEKTFMFPACFENGFLRLD